MRTRRNKQPAFRRSDELHSPSPDTMSRYIERIHYYLIEPSADASQNEDCSCNAE